MRESIRNNYFLAVRMGLLLAVQIYISFTESMLTGASFRLLLLLALLIGVMAGKELFWGKGKGICLLAAGMLCLGIWLWYGKAFSLLVVFYLFELCSFLKLSLFWYLFPFVFMLFTGETGRYESILLTLFLFFIYIQHDFIISSYRKQSKEEIESEQQLKHHMKKQENEMREAISRSALAAENKLLEERARLSQILHDKLGHNINGSIYQLEAAKLLLEKQPDTSKNMIQAVINELRGGMDEIRAILRKERPQKYQLTLLRLQKLCEECQSKGVEANLWTQGELSDVPKECLEVILDNAFEAVSNSLKYAKCSKIEIKLYVFHQMVRCSISDNGIGCDSFIDGMGIEGMRERMRNVNGILNFETEKGFTVNMLFKREGC